MFSFHDLKKGQKERISHIKAMEAYHITDGWQSRVIIFFEVSIK